MTATDVASSEGRDATRRLSDGAGRSYSVAVLGGDGIGPEVVGSAQRILEHVAHLDPGFSLSFEPHSVGFAELERTGTSMSDAVAEAVKQTDAVLFGAVDVARFPAGTEDTLMRLRKLLDVSVSVRPSKSFQGVRGPGAPIDVLVVREITEGFYSGIEYAVGNEGACAVRVVTRSASRRAARVAFEHAQTRSKRLTAVHKVGAFKLTDRLFLEAVEEVAADFPDVEHRFANVDACAFDIVTKPGELDVILATNAFGDIVSDVAAGMAGGLGLASSACIGDRYAYFEPVHGTAPDIAGKGVANPIGAILSAAMMLGHFGELEAAGRIQLAVEHVLAEGTARSGDLGGGATTAMVTDAVIDAITE
jgi:isocitrate/isopropylmalate dehydrogenase